MMHICDHRTRRFHTLQGPVELTCRLDHCPDPDCPGHTKTKSPELEIALALPQWAIGWDVFCWIGHRRCRGTLGKEKPPIFGMIQRTGEVVIRMLENVQ
jgi:hypothetical protein